MILCVKYVGIRSEVPQERGGTGPWEALEMWLWPSCALGLPSLQSSAPRCCAGRGTGHRTETNCTWRLREGEGGGPSHWRAGWWAGHSLQGPGPPVPPVSLPSQAGSDSRPRAYVLFLFLFLNKKLPCCPLSLSVGKAGPPASVQEESLIPLPGPIFAGGWDGVGIGLIPPSCVSVLCCRLSHSLDSVWK